MWEANGYEAETLNELCRKIGKAHYEHDYGIPTIREANYYNDYGHGGAILKNGKFDIQEKAEKWRLFYERMLMVSLFIESFWINKDIDKLEAEYDNDKKLSHKQYISMITLVFAINKNATVR